MTPESTPRRRSAAERCAPSAVSDPKFWARTKPENGCRVWTGYRDRQGYGLVGRPAIQKSPMLTHRYAFLLTYGPIPEGAVIRHSCDNPPCVEPTHLLEGTQADNIADRQARGRHRPGKLLGEAHPAHKLTEDDVREIREAYANGYSTGYLSEHYGVARRTIYMAATGQTWTHLKDAA